MESIKRIAIVGGGAAGIAAAHVLGRKHEVTLFEASDRLGGHANSVAIEDFEVDTAFLVFNNGSYPLFLKLLDQLGVADTVQDSDMSMSFHNRETGLQYAVNKGLGGLFCQKRNLVRPAYWGLLREISRFRALTEIDSASVQSLGDFVRSNANSRVFAENFLYPLGASVWSLPTDSMAEFPIDMFFRFFAHHKALKLEKGAKWRTMVGGSIQYIRAFQKGFRGRVVINQPILKIQRSPSGVTLLGQRGEVGRFDGVVLATHADQSLKMLSEPSSEETRLLGAWRYQSNPTVLHTDETVMPKIKRAWSSWSIGFEDGRYGVSYHLNRVQKLSARKNYFISFGDCEVAKEKVLMDFDYRHPVFTRSALESQSKLGALNGERNTYFCGSYFGNGFHEDAIRSAVEVTRKFGMEL